MAETTPHYDKEAEVNQLAFELDEFMQTAVKAGAAEVVGVNEKGHALYQFTDTWDAWCEENRERWAAEKAHG